MFHMYLLLKLLKEKLGDRFLKDLVGPLHQISFTRCIKKGKLPQFCLSIMISRSKMGPS